MKILSIATYSNAVQYYRHKVPNAALRKHGVEIDHYLLENIVDEFDTWLVENAKNYDLIHTGYMATEAALSCMAAIRNHSNIPFISDLDDDIYNVPEYNPAFTHYHPAAKNRRLVRMGLRISDAVSVSTEPLNELLQRDTNMIATLPNCLEPTDWDNAIKKRKQWDGPCVMFAGNLGRSGDLACAREGIETFMRCNPSATLLFMGCTPDWAAQWMASKASPSANRCFYIRICGDIHTYRAILNWLAPDVFINPIVQNKFNESKSHIKAFDAAMCGAAFVCTDWRTNDEVPGDCAIKIDNTRAQWEEALSAAAYDKSLKKRLNTRLVDWALETQTIDKHVHKWIELYESVIAKGPITSLDEIVRPGVGGGDGMDSRQASQRQSEPAG